MIKPISIKPISNPSGGRIVGDRVVVPSQYFHDHSSTILPRRWLDDGSEPIGTPERGGVTARSAQGIEARGLVRPQLGAPPKGAGFPSEERDGWKDLQPPLWFCQNGR